MCSELMVAREGIVRWGGHVHTTIFKRVTNKDLLYNPGTLLSVIQQTGWEGKRSENLICSSPSSNGRLG